MEEPDLAKSSGVSVSTVNSFDLERRQPINANHAAIRSALEASGVAFIADNGGVPGVRLKRAPDQCR